MPLIEFSPGSELSILRFKLSSLRDNDLIFALSERAVSYAHSTLTRLNVKWPASVNYYAIGPTTGLKLESACGSKVIWPTKYKTSEGLIGLIDSQELADKNALILCGNGGRRFLSDELKKHRVNVESVECYKRSNKHYNGMIEGPRWKNIGIDTLVITSSGILHHILELFQSEVERRDWLFHLNLVVASERLAKNAKNLGWNSIKVAQGADNESLFAALNRLGVKNRFVF
jgi:uroporphyrinogen-III synthase